MTRFITRLIAFIAITAISQNDLFAQLGTVPTLASSNVSEASQYGVVYALDIPNTATNYSTQSAIHYAINNSGLSGINFKRVAYFLQLDSKWVWASMDKFNSSVSLTDLGIPAGNSSVYFQQIVNNLHVYGSSGSNVTNITSDGTNGNVEIWPQCYSQGVGLAGIGGNSGTFDFNDTRSSGGGCYGSFQVHNYGLSQTIFAFNSWTNSNVPDLGIGNNSGNANPDWTFMYNAGNYTTRKLYILVDYGISSPTPVTQSLCINTSPTILTVNAAAQTGTTISSYNWYSNSTNSSTGGTLLATHTTSATSDTYTPSNSTIGTTYYYATMTNSAGTVVTGGTASVTVNPYPTATISGTTSVCQNATSPTITFTGASGTAPYTFTYNINGGTNLTTTTGLTAPTSASGTFNYNLVGVQDASSSSCYQNQSGTATITVNALPTATISAGSTTTFCSGGSVTLTASVGSSYLWSSNAGSATTASTNVSSAGNYTVKVTDANGCSNTSAATTVTVNSLPVVSPITGITSVEILAVGAGGGAGGPDGALGAGGGAGGAVYGKYTLTSASNVYTVGVGGAGYGGIGCYSNSAGGTGGTNGGGTGGNAGTGGCSGSGGGGGGWSGLYQGSNYIVVAGGGAGGGGSNEGTANDVATPGGGSQPAGANGSSMTGGNGTAFSGDGGGGGAGGGGYYGGAGQANLTSNGQASGGANFANSTNQIASTLYTGASGATQSAGSAGGAPVTVTNASNFGYNNTYGKGGNGVGNGNTTAQTAGTNGIVIIRYPGAPTATGGTITQSGGYTIHTFTNPGSNTFTVNPSNVVCVGSTLALSSLTTGGVWSSSDNSIATIDASTGLVTGISAGAVTITYTVTNSNGCVGSTTSTVTVNPLPSTTISTSGSTSICSGSSVTLTAAVATTYAWSTGATTQGITVSTAGNYSVTITNSSGCSATSTAAVVTVNPLPTVTITAGGATTFCSGGSVALTASTGVSYLWSSGETTSSITSTNTGNYTVTVTDANGCSNTSAATTVTVNALPIPILTANGATTICSGGAVTLSAGGAGDAINFNGSSKYINVQNHANIPVGNSNYTLEAWIKPSQSSNGGILGWGSWGNTNQVNAFRLNGSSQLINYWWANDLAVNTPNLADGNWHHVAATYDGTTRSIYVDGVVKGSDHPSGHNIPNANNIQLATTNVNEYFYGGIDEVRIWNVARTQSQIQSSMNSSVPANSTGLAAYYKFDEGTGTTTADATGNGNNGTLVNSPTWINPSTAPLVNYSSYLWSNGATTSSITASTSGNYSVQVTNSNGCSNSSSATTVTVNDLPTATITVGGATTFCAGGSVTLTASAGTSYLWSNGATTQSINVTTGGSYTVTVTNSNGCSATSLATVVTVNALPAATITAGSATTFCAGGSVTLTASAGSSYLWSTGETSQSISVNSTGSFTVQVTNSNGCSATSAATTVTVNTLPTPTISAGSVTTFCSGGSVTLTASAGSGYSWSNGAITQSTTVTTSNNYSVTVTDANGCSATTTATTVTVNALPTASITSGSTSTCPGNTITLSANTGTGLTYQWLKGGVNISGATSSTYDATNSGVYSVIVTNSNNCSTTSNSITITIQDITAPTVVTQPVTVYLDATGNASLTASQVNNGSTDNCGIASMSLSKSTFTCSDINLNSSALTFNSSTDGVTTNANATNLPFGNGARTLSLWVKNTSGGSSLAHYGTGDCNGLMFGIGISGSSPFFWGGCRDHVSSSLQITTGQWTYLAVTYDGNSNYTMYKDNSSESFTLSGGLNTNVSKFFIGHETTNNGANYRGEFTGSIDEVKVYNRALSASEIAADRAGVNQSGIVAYFPFSEGSGTTINDAVGGNTATLQNPTGSNWVTRNNGNGPATTTLTVTDVNGNHASASANVTVLDNIAPSITCPANINAYTGTGKCSATISITNATATDNCSVASVAGVRNDGLALTADYPKGTTTITWTATDASGNSTNCNQTVTVTDNIPPSISCPSDQSLIASSAAGVTATYTAPVGTDNCSGVTTARTAGLASGSTFPIGVNTVTHTATDAAGNTTSCSFNITVLGVPPTITCPSDITLNNETGVCGAHATFGTPTTTGYPAPVVTYSVASGSFFSVGTTTVTVTATNAVGHASCSFNVTVNDITAPTITCPSDIVVPATDLIGADVTYTAPVGTDNCSGATTVRTVGQASGYHFHVGTTTITHTVTDASNNTAYCSFNVTVNPLPLATISGDAEVCNNSTAPSVTFTGSNATAPYTFTYTINGGSPLTVTSNGNTAIVTAPTNTTGNFVYTLVSVKDASLTHTTNSASGSVTVIIDTLPIPVISGPTFGCGPVNGNVSYTASAGVSYLWNHGYTPNSATNTFSDSISYTVSLTVTDGHGCFASTTKVIPANTEPTVTSIENYKVSVERPEIGPMITIGDHETPDNLVITATSSNQTFVPNSKIHVSGRNLTRMIGVDPAQDKMGTATITVKVQDCGGLYSTTSFTITDTVPNYPQGTANFVVRHRVSQIDNCSDSVYFVNRSYNGPGTSYEWYINGTYFTQPSYPNSPNGMIGFKTQFPGTYTALLVITDHINGTSYSVSKTFTLTRGMVPVPTPSFVNYGVYPNGSGTATVQLNSTTPYVQGGINYLWNITPATNVVSSAPSGASTVLSISQTATAQHILASLTVTPVTGCTSYTTAVQTLTIPAYSAISAGISTSQTNSIADHCNDSVTIFNTTSGGIGNTYTWYLGDGTTINTTSTAPIGKVYTYPGTYTILLNITDQTGAVASKQWTITTTGTIPPVSAHAIIYGPNYNYTSNTASVTLDGGNSSTAYGSLNYSWTLTPSGATTVTFNKSDSTFTFAQTSFDQNFTSILTVTDALKGCRTDVATKTFTVAKLAAPPVAPSPIVADFNIGHTPSLLDHCNDSVYIINNTSGGAGNNTYTWYLGDGTTFNTASTTPIGKIYTYPSTYTVVLNVTDQNGAMASVQKTITTNGTIPAVTANPTLYGPAYTATDGSVILNGSNSGIAYGSLKYVWTITPVGGSASTYDTSTVSLTIPRTSTDQYYTAILTVTDALTSCRSNSATQSFTITQLAPVVTPPVIPPVTPSVISADFTIGHTPSLLDHCNDSVYIINNTTGGSGNTYIWYLGDGTNITTTSPAPIGKVYTYPAKYTILLNVKDQSGNYASKQTTVYTIATVPPVQAYAQLYGPYNGSTTSAVTLSGGNSSTAYGSLSYKWVVTVGGVSTTYNTASISLSIPMTNADQNYTAVLTVTDVISGCRVSTDTKTFTIPALSSFVGTGYFTEQENNSITVFPNPTHNLVTIKLTIVNNAEDVYIKVYNSIGTVVSSKQFATGSSNMISTELSMAHLAGGLYFVKAFNNRGELIGTSTFIRD